MRKAVLIIWFVLFPVFFCSGQHLIGIEKSLIPDLVKEEINTLNLDNSARNQHFNYLKFINSEGTKTLFVFFNDQNISTSTRLICDYSELEAMTKDLKKKYRKIDDNTWMYAINEIKYIVSLEPKEWYFVVSVKRSSIDKENKKRFFLWKRQNY